MRISNRPSTYRKGPPNLDRYTCSMALNIVARKVEIAKANNGGTTPYGTLSGIVAKLKPNLPWLTRAMLRTHIKKINKAKKVNQHVQQMRTTTQLESIRVVP